MEDEKITLGVVVRLKSGGPAMTTNVEHDYDIWMCAWFDNQNNYQTANISAKALEILK